LGAAFFAAARLWFALATTRFAAFLGTEVRAFPRLADFAFGRFGNFPRFCAFDFFLRLAMTDPRWLVLADQKTTRPVRQPIQPVYQQIVGGRCVALVG